jgi:hypothetical protein
LTKRPKGSEGFLTSGEEAGREGGDPLVRGGWLRIERDGSEGGGGGKAATAGEGVVVEESWRRGSLVRVVMEAGEEDRGVGGRSEAAVGVGSTEKGNRGGC